MNPIKTLPKILKTQRLEMRQLEPTLENATLIYDVLKNEDPNDFYYNPITTNDILPQSAEDMLDTMNQQEEWIKTSGVIYYIFLNNKLIGYRRFYYKPDIETMHSSSAWFVKSERQKGYGLESFKVVEKLAFEEMGVNRITRDCDPRNDLSAKSISNSGFHLDGVTRQSMINPDGSFSDAMLWSKLKTEYFK